MKKYTVKRGRYRTTRTKVERPATTAEDLREQLTAGRRIRNRAYEDAMARGDLGVIADCLDRDLSLDQVLADARRIAEPILAAGLPRPKFKGETMKEDGEAFAAEVFYHMRGVAESFKDADDATRSAVVEAVLLGYRWAQLVTNQGDASGTNRGRESQQRRLTERQEKLGEWLRAHQLRAGKLLYAGANREAAFDAWAAGRKKGTSQSTFLRDVHALIAAGH